MWLQSVNSILYRLPICVDFPAVKKILLVSALIALVLAVVAVLVVVSSMGTLIKTGIEAAGPALTKTEVKLDSASVSLLSGSGEIRGLMIGNPSGYKTPAAIKVGLASLSLDAGSLLKDKVVIRSIKVDAPEITFETNLKANNLSAILANVQAAAEALPGGSTSAPAEKQPATDAKGGRKLEVDEFVLSNAKLSVSASLLGGKELKLSLPEIRLTNLGTGPDGITPAALTKELLSAITTSSVKAAEQAIAGSLKAIGNAASAEAVNGAADSVKNATKGLGDLFKKKN